MDLDTEIDPIWTSSRTARQIYVLGEVEKVWVATLHSLVHLLTLRRQDLSRLLSLAASSISLLSLPQTDGPEDGLPQGGERSEQFVLEVSEYFERLDVRQTTVSRCSNPPLTSPNRQSIQISMRSSLAHIRHSRIAPSAINAPPPGFVPPSLGVSSPSSPAEGANAADSGGRGLQEERVERDAWLGILTALTRLKETRDREQQAEAQYVGMMKAHWDGESTLG